MDCVDFLVGYGFVIFCVCRGLWVAIGGCPTIVGFAVACVANGDEMIWVFLEGFAMIVCCRRLW